jgi:hypothetical protein
MQRIHPARAAAGLLGLAAVDFDEVAEAFDAELGEGHGSVLVLRIVHPDQPVFRLHVEGEIGEPVRFLTMIACDERQGPDGVDLVDVHLQGASTVDGAANAKVGGRRVGLVYPGDAGQHIGEPGLWIDVIHLRCLDQRCHGRGPLGAAVGARKQPGFSTEGKTSERSLGSIVGEAGPPVVEERGKAVPAPEHVVDRLSDGRRAREREALFAEPGAHVGDERAAALLPDLTALVGAQTVDLALDGKERVDALHRFQCDRRHGHDAGSAPCARGNVGELKEAATGVGPSKRRPDRPARTRWIIEPVVPHRLDHLHDRGITSSVSVTSSPSFDSLIEPQHGQDVGAGTNTRSRGRCSGKGLRTGWRRCAGMGDATWRDAASAAISASVAFASSSSS